MSIFDDIKTGLNQAIDFEKGKGKARVTVMTIHPVDQFSPDEIKQIRTETGMAQVLFAQYMGVSVKTVEAWEAGRNHPVGAACRLLAMTKKRSGISSEIRSSRCKSKQLNQQIGCRFVRFSMW